MFFMILKKSLTYSLVLQRERRISVISFEQSSNRSALTFQKYVWYLFIRVFHRRVNVQSTDSCFFFSFLSLWPKLVEVGTDGNFTKNALHLAAWKGSVEAIELLVNAGKRHGIDLVNVISTGEGNYGKTREF